MKTKIGYRRRLLDNHNHLSQKHPQNLQFKMCARNKMVQDLVRRKGRSASYRNRNLSKYQHLTNGHRHAKDHFLPLNLRSQSNPPLLVPRPKLLPSIRIISHKKFQKMKYITVTGRNQRPQTHSLIKNRTPSNCQNTLLRQSNRDHVAGHSLQSEKLYDPLHLRRLSPRKPSKPKSACRWMTSTLRQKLKRRL
jgi:hypothetical protein